MERTQHKGHDDHIAGKGHNSLSHYNLVHKFIPMPQAMKIPEAWQLTKVRRKKEIHQEARTERKTVHFATLMDICHLENAVRESQFQKYIGRVVLRGDIVKDSSGSFTAFTEQGSSASQMTAAKVMNVIARLPGCAGQEADAVSAYTQVKMEDAPVLFKIQIGVSRHMDTSTTTQVAKILVQYGRTSRSSGTKLIWSSIFKAVVR